MRRILGTGGVVAAVVVAFWRLLASLAHEHRRLTVSGELGGRVAAARRGRIDRALTRERLRPAIRVPVAVVRPLPRGGSHASISTGERGAAGSDHEFDDLDLLDASMRRRSPARPAGSDAAPHMQHAVEVAATELIADANEVRPGEFAWLEGGERDRTRTDAGVLGPALMAVGLIGTFVPLVRPLGDASPWIALGSAVLVGLGWWRARS
ncbi:MAG: hypothetical protein JWN72_2131 [Thermoleophilia bacterium]|nr:hypothetical protein [Thermoleophilia bacterium]